MASVVFELSPEEVLTIYEEIVGTSRLTASRSPELLESAVAAPFQTFDGRHLYHDLFSMAAALLRSIVQNQPFIDGNQRAAWASTMLFLSLNGLEVVSASDTAMQLMKDIAKRKLTVTQIAQRLAQDVQKVGSADGAICSAFPSTVR